MKCAIGDQIEVTPKGCLPVSTDMCASGFMAPSENITHPEDALTSCCRCRDGETCEYCLDKDNCTDAEKNIYVTNNDCFMIEPSPSSSVEPSVGPSVGPSAGPSAGSLVESFNLMKFKWYILAFIIILVIGFFVRRKSKIQSI